MGINIKIVAYGIGAIFALFGCWMVYEGSKVIPTNQELVNNGWLLIILAFFIWLLTWASKKF
jgi:membrane associated rhomboid family serine protease